MTTEDDMDRIWRERKSRARLRELYPERNQGSSWVEAAGVFLTVFLLLGGFLLGGFLFYVAIFQQETP